MDAGRERLDACLASLDPQALLRPGVVGNWSVKDILAHLVGWNNALLGWYQAGLDGLPGDNPGGKQETDDFN